MQDSTRLCGAASASKPEILYRDAKTPAERRHIQEAVVLAYRPLVAEIAGIVPPKHRREAEQVGAIGVLVALEKFDPAIGNFATVAAIWIKHEIQTWMNIGIYWRKSPKQSETHRTRTGKAGETFSQQRFPREFHEEEDSSNSVSAEDVLSHLEALSRLQDFANTLSADDRHLLFCEKRQIKGSDPNSPRRRRYLSLVEQARLFVMGDSDGRPARVRDHIPPRRTK